MNVLIAGAGGVGGYLGARLGEDPLVRVTLLARGAHADAIRQNGLKIVEDTQTSSFHPHRVITSLRETPDRYDLVILSVKEPDLDPILQDVRPHVHSRTRVLSLLNGVEYRPRIRRALPEVDALEGCIYILSNIEAPGVIRKKGDVFRLCWGHESFRPEEYADLIALFDRTLPRHRPTERIALEQWKKFLFISVMAALTTQGEIPMDQVPARFPERFEGMLRELSAVARAKGVPLLQSDLDAVHAQCSKLRPGAKTSMQLDFERGKATELEALVGWVLRQGRALGIPTPNYESVYATLKERG
ncbi:ketopantoate reductase family protein [Nitratifractor sp.]